MTSQKTPAALYSELITAIVKAVPEASTHTVITQVWPYRQGGCIHCGINDIKMLTKKCSKRPITLEHVLMTLAETPKTSKYVVDDGGRFWDFNRVRFTSCVWHFDRPLSDQTPECILFLHTLLCHD